jgi:hypothetical protein
MGERERKGAKERERERERERESEFPFVGLTRLRRNGAAVIGPLMA